MMKAYFSRFLPVSLLMFAQAASAQTVRVSVNPSAATIALNSNTSSSDVKVKTKEPQTGVVAFLPGYTTQGITAQELANTGQSDYTIKLTKIKKPAAGFTSKKIEFTILKDGTAKLNKGSTVQGFYGFTTPGAELSDVKFAKAMQADLAKAGYKVVGTNSMFNSKSDIPDIALGGEVTWFAKETHGPGFQVSVLVHWSLYSVAQENVVYETTTAGYSDSRNGGLFADELVLALKDALAGVIYDPKFHEMAIKKSETPATALEAISLSKPAVKKLDSYSAVVKESVGSVVTVKTNFGYGSGFIISESGYILTNHHVVNSAEKIDVVFENGFSFEAKLIRSSESKDVALIKISGSGFKPLVLNASDDLSGLGAEVIAIGTPENVKLGQTVTKGIISGKRELDEKVYLQTDVAINSGNSGGPLINTSTGEVIGIVAAKIKAKGVEGLGFAIPIAEAIAALSLKFE